VADRIRLNGMSFYAYHGVSPAERETGRRFEVDCELEVDLAEPGRSDALGDTIDYAAVYEVVRETVEGQAYSLLEGLAGELARRLLDRFPVYGVSLRVRKMDPPIAGHIRNIEVEMTRDQGDTSKLLNDDNA